MKGAVLSVLQYSLMACSELNLSYRVLLYVKVGRTENAMVSRCNGGSEFVK